MERIDLVIDARMFKSSGIGEYLKNIVQHFRSGDFEIAYLTGPTIPDQLKASRIRVLKAKVYSPLEQLIFPLLVPSSKIFWSPHYNTPLFLPNVKTRIATIHDVFHITPLSELSFFKKIYAWLLLYNAIMRSDRIITVSDFSKSEILKYFKWCDKSKIVVIRNGVRQNVSWKSFELIKRKYCLPDHYILFVGNVKKHKNIRGLLEAFLILEDEFKDKYKVVIVGKKDGFRTEDKELFEWIDSNALLVSNVIFTGYVDDEDIDSVYHYSSLFVFPSFYEGFGLPPLEAMINLCPVISSNKASMPEICKDAALYFDPNDIPSIKDKIELVLSDSFTRESLVSAGLNLVKNYQWSESANLHQSQFLTLVHSVTEC